MKETTEFASEPWGGGDVAAPPAEVSDVSILEVCVFANVYLLLKDTWV